jgi:hypothetical protein
MTMGQAYSDIFPPRAQEALEMGCNWIIDHCFEDYPKANDPESFEQSILGTYLPSRYLQKYTPLFFKQFTVCVITVAWKLAQPHPLLLASIAEELAALAIIQAAKDLTEDDVDGEEIDEALETFIDAYFEDLDSEFLFDGSSDGLDESEVGKALGMASLAFSDWFRPFSPEASRTVHPYVASL